MTKTLVRKPASSIAASATPALYFAYKAAESMMLIKAQIAELDYAAERVSVEADYLVNLAARQQIIAKEIE